MNFCIFCGHEIPINVEEEVRKLIAPIDFVQIRFHGPYKAVVLYRDKAGVYQTCESVVDEKAETWTQEKLNLAHIATLTKALRP